MEKAMGKNDRNNHVDANGGTNPVGWRDKVQALIDANAHRRVNGRVAAHRTQEHNATVIFNAMKTLHALNHPVKDPYNLKDRHVQLLVDYWYEEGKAASTMRNDLSVLRKFFGWMGVRTLKEYLPDAPLHRIQVSSRPEGNRSKSWSKNGIDVEQKLQEAFAIDERFGMIVAMQLAFGYRRKETICIRPWVNDLRPRQNAFMMYERDGTKGGRMRLIPIEFPFQAWILDYVKERVAKRSNLGWPKTRRGDNATLIQNLERYKTCMKKLGIGRADVSVTGHGLRAEYTENCALLEGFVPATLGGKGNQMSRDDLRVRQIRVSERLGHSRPRITENYYGKFEEENTGDKSGSQPSPDTRGNDEDGGAPPVPKSGQSPEGEDGNVAPPVLTSGQSTPTSFMDIIGSYYDSMPAERERPDPSKPPVPGIGRFAAADPTRAATKKPARRGRQKGAVKMRPYDERQLRLPLKLQLPDSFTRVRKGGGNSNE
jgi:site-specific recombinase XerD